MKKKLIIAVLVILALTLLTRRYNLIEKNDVLPVEVQSLLGGQTAHAQEMSEQDYLREEVQKPREFLEKGDRGEQVQALQQRLYELGFMSDTTDGIFGDETESAVSALREYLRERETERAQRAETQRAQHLSDTRAALEPQHTGHAGQALRRSRQANEEMQRVLQPQGSKPAPQQPAQPDELRGTVSQSLWIQLNDQAFLTNEGELSLGAQGSRVSRLQQRLKNLGYHMGAVDGDFGVATNTSLLAFQKYNDLPMSGQADQATLQKLYSGAAEKAVRPSHPYLLKISVDKQRVYAYEWNVLDQDYTTLARTMICSTGLNDTPTPKGTFTNTTPVVRWGYFPKFDCWAQYLYRINGSILFHSVIYDAADESTVRWGSVHNLGSKASHGCVRLTVEDARWLYSNCPAGTTVVVY